MPFNGCRLCGKEVHELHGAYLIRVNEKGIPGIWECRPACGSTLSQGELLLRAINQDDSPLPAAPKQEECR